MKLKRHLFYIVSAGMIFLLSACGKKDVSETESPRLVSGEILSGSEGSEDSQTVTVNLTFDREVSVSDTMDSLRVTISEERMEGRMQMGGAPDTVSLVIPVKAVTSGVLKIRKAETADTIDAILDAGGSYAVQDFELEGMIPSGVVLSTAESGEGTVTKQVDSSWSIRSIAWAALIRDGELVPVSEQRPGEERDGYAAVHGHEFLMEDEKDVAEKITETLENNYGEEYRFSWDGSRITAKSADGKGNLDIEINQYLKINGKDMEPGASPEPEDEKKDAGEEKIHGEEGLKVKTMEITREISPKEQDFLDKLHISHMEAFPGYDGISGGGELYTWVSVTGKAMSEKQIYSVRDLETLIRDSFQNESLYSYGLPLEQGGYYGIHLTAFLGLCGVEQKDNVSIRFTGRNGEEKTYSLKELTDGVSMLALGNAEATWIVLFRIKAANVIQLLLSIQMRRWTHWRVKLETLM